MACHTYLHHVAGVGHNHVRVVQMRALLQVLHEAVE